MATREKRTLERPPMGVFACALFVLVFTCCFNWGIFGHSPHINDEIANVFQAKIFALGKLTVPSPCAREHFDFTHIINNGQWYSHYPPGFPALLLGGVLLGAPWLINPLLAALSILVFFYLGKEIYDRRVGTLTALVGAVSIWFLVMSSSLMSHTSCMFFLALFLLFIFRSYRQPTVLNGALAGAALGMALLIRPHPAVFFSLPFLLILGIRFLKSPRTRWRNGLSMAGLGLIFLALFLGYNAATNDHPLRMGYEVSHGPGHGIGFGKSGYMDVPHSPQKGSEQLGLYLGEMNNRMFGWPLSSFLGLIPLIFGFRWLREHSRRDLLLLSGFFSLFVSLFFYWGTFILIGARMVFESVPVFFLLTARGIDLTHNWLAGKFNQRGRSRAHFTISVCLAVFILFAFFVRLPHWINPPVTEWYSDGFPPNFERVNPAIHLTLKDILPEGSLVVMKFLYHPLEYFPQGWWGSGFQHNDPQLAEPLIYATYIPGELDRLNQCFPDRRLFFYYGTLEKGMLFPITSEASTVRFQEPITRPSKTRAGFELVEEPEHMFTPYSPGFERFLEGLYQTEDYSAIDVPALFRQGDRLFNLSRFSEASLAYEAALQIEKSPKEREVYLNMLAKCYYKLRRYSEARAITERLKEFNYKKYYKIFPEKGI
jgi:hypothetical protein